MFRNTMILGGSAVLGLAIVACADARNEPVQRQKATVCTAEYAPVCDAAGNIYQNTCTAISAGALVAPSCHVMDLATPVETPHPYSNNERRAWSIEAPAGALSLRVEFASFHTESGYDVVRLFDASAEVAAYSGNRGRFVSAAVQGNRASIVFNSDGSVTRQGFVVRRYVYFTPCECRMMYHPVCGVDGRTYDNSCEASCGGIQVAFHAPCEEGFFRVNQTVESAHPYANHANQTWTVSEAGSYIRAHFASIDTEQNYDFVEILDGEDNVVLRYTGRHQDVITPLVPGGQLKIRLVSDYSVTGPGFVMDWFEVAGGCYDGHECPQGQGCTQVQCFRAPCWKVCMDCPSFTMPPPWYCDGGVVVARDDLDGCPLPPRCERTEGATCGGEHDFPCDDGFVCVEGTCRAAPAQCFVGGCNAEVCSDRPDVVTTCVAQPFHACYGLTTCGVQANGLCGWTETPELLECLAQNGGLPGHEAGDNEMCGGITGIGCKVGLECVGVDPNVPDGSGICRKICGPSIPSGFCQDGFFCNITAGADHPNTCSQLGRSGVCLPTPTACPRIYLPVCGCDGVTYGNDCERQVAGAALDHQGPCEGDNTCEVPSTCTGIHPMCMGEWSCIEGLCEYQCDPHRYFGQDTPLAIPDGGSVRSTIMAGHVGVIERITVSVDITHTWRGDLIVELSKGGTVVVLHARTGGSTDDLQLLDVPVSAFNGQQGDGEWTLTVTDAATWDTGTLNSWMIDIN